MDQRLGPAISSLQAATQQNQNKLAAIETSLNELELQFTTAHQSAPGNNRGNGLPENSLENRIAKLEKDLFSLEQKTAEVSPDPAVDTTAESLRASLRQSKSGNRNAYKRGEELFQSDYGTAMGYEEETLSDVFQNANERIGLKDVNCKRTICRVTYQYANVKESSSGDINAARASLINDISDKYENADLHFIHGADDDGNQVMYIKTQ